jgi:SpoU rRNA methylase family enzyme
MASMMALCWHRGMGLLLIRNVDDALPLVTADVRLARKCAGLPELDLRPLGTL